MEIKNTKIQNLDKLLGGGFPTYSLNFVAGPPGTGKTIMMQQMLFKNEGKALYLTTLSEPMSKVIRYMQNFEFFKEEEFDSKVVYRDIGSMVKTRKLEDVLGFILEQIEEVQPEYLCIDSFKAIRDMVEDEAAFRKFTYDLSVNLSVFQVTTFLIGEYSLEEIAGFAEFAVADGILFLSIAEVGGEQQRLIKVLKLRGQAVNLSAFPFLLSSAGFKVLDPTSELEKIEVKKETETSKVETGIAGLDALLKQGIPRGRTLLVSGVSGTGKTTLAIQYLCHGAKNGEKGLLISTEESSNRIIELAKGFGFNIDELVKKKLIKIIYIPQDQLEVEKNLDNLILTIKKFKPQRFVLDSFSMFLHKLKDPSLLREKAYQLTNIIHKFGVTGLFISDIEAGSNRFSRFGIEETVMDGLIILSSEMEGNSRKRFIEVYKVRGTEHIPGKHRMEISSNGLDVFYFEHKVSTEIPDTLEFNTLSELVQGTSYGSVWLTQGEQGAGKSTLAYQFAIEGLKRKESVLFIGLEAFENVIKREMENWQILVDPYIESGYLRILDQNETDGNFIDIRDLNHLIYEINNQLETMPRPCRIIIDSLNPIAIHHDPDSFVKFVEFKNRILRQPDVVAFETLLSRTLEERILYNALISYDVFIDLYTPSWGEMEQSGHGMRAIKVRKTRGATADNRIHPYIIKPGEGIVIQKEVYRWQDIK